MNRVAIRRKSLPLSRMKIFDSIKPLFHRPKVNLPSPEEMEHLAAEGKMVLRTEDLVKKYGQRTVANHVSINVRQGEIVGLLGPNGAGKTTTFYMTTGLITPTKGASFSTTSTLPRFPSIGGRNTVSAIWRRRRRCFASYRLKTISLLSCR